MRTKARADSEPSRVPLSSSLLGHMSLLACAGIVGFGGEERQRAFRWTDRLCFSPRI